ncbi:methyltransferase family protein [Anatilimnocola floriformis]|uniref:methyltransferase family protein n=1 Tax=Anatilimnocola floriformis TaxID=2948575 RepID=UPI0020C4EA69|nr:isoprenylcysteine carboxylmethyltransferase family protein [Anatilimnocola floriformis]
MEKNVVERLRIAVTRIALIAVFLLAVFSESIWTQNELTEETMFGVGLLLTFIGCLGRVWCLIHIAGRKNNELVTAGPYSLCRNPLYLFSFIGTLGVAFSTCTFTIPLLAAVCFLAYYPMVIRSEERRLAQIHGAAFATYCSRVPQFIPSFRAYTPVEQTTVKVHLFVRGLLDVAWFLLAILLSHLNSELHEAGYGITLMKLI